MAGDYALETLRLCFRRGVELGASLRPGDTYRGPIGEWLVSGVGLRERARPHGDDAIRLAREAFCEGYSRHAPPRMVTDRNNCILSIEMPDR